MQKISVNAGFTCPNRDGKISTLGCSYCNNSAFNPSYCTPEKSITQQITEGIEFHTNRYRRAEKYVVYFQAFSNTYAPIPVLREKYEEALSHPGVIGLTIGTRPDCVNTGILNYLEQLSKGKFITLEYGVESCYDASLLRINRGHTFEQSIFAITETAKRGINTVVHLIFGLPGETSGQMLHSAEIISQLPVNSIKLHQLQIIRDTPMALQYRAKPEDFHFFSLEEYIDFIIDFTERLNPAVMIERFSAEVPPRFLEAGGFGLLRTDQILQKIEKRMDERNAWQGRLYKELPRSDSEF